MDGAVGRARRRAGLVAGWVGWWYIERINPKGEPGDPVKFTVRDGDDLDSLATRSRTRASINETSVFPWYVDSTAGSSACPATTSCPGDHMGNV